MLICQMNQIKFFVKFFHITTWFIVRLAGLIRLKNIIIWQPWIWHNGKNYILMANGGRLERIKKHRRQTKKKTIQNWNNQHFTIYADMHERINTMTTQWQHTRQKTKQLDMNRTQRWMNQTHRVEPTVLSIDGKWAFQGGTVKKRGNRTKIETRRSRWKQRSREKAEGTIRIQKLFFLGGIKGLKENPKIKTVEIKT